MKYSVARLALMTCFAIACPVQAGLTEGKAAYDKRDFALARQELQALAEDNHAEAIYVLGLLETSRLNKDGDAAKGLSLLRKASDLGHLPAMFKLAEETNRGNRSANLKANPEMALTLYIEAAERGYSPAMMWLGRYFDQQETPQWEKAFQWYRKAAESGHEGGIQSAGLRLIKGLGTPVDDHAARQLIESASKLAATLTTRISAANAGDMLLAVLQYEGRAGFEADEKKAAILVCRYLDYAYASPERRGSENPFTDMICNSPDLALHTLAAFAMTSGHYGYDRPDLALRIYQSLAERGDSFGLMAEAFMTWKGIGTTANPRLGASLLRALTVRNKDPYFGLWSAVNLAEIAYRDGDLQRAAILLPDPASKTYLAALQRARENPAIFKTLGTEFGNELLRQLQLPEDLLENSKQKDWIFDLALKTGAIAPVVFSAMTTGGTLLKPTIEGRELTPGEQQQWSTLVEIHAKNHPEIRALLVSERLANATSKKTASSELTRLKQLEAQGSLYAGINLFSFFDASDEDFKKARKLLGIEVNAERSAQYRKRAFDRLRIPVPN